jgi:hypothetical protein
MTYDTAQIMRDAHRAARKFCRDFKSYAEAFKFYLGQKWLQARMDMSVARCTGATVAVAKAFDNNNSPLWRL